MNYLTAGVNVPGVSILSLAISRYFMTWCVNRYCTRHFMKMELSLTWLHPLQLANIRLPQYRLLEVLLALRISFLSALSSAFFLISLFPRSHCAVLRSS